MDLSAQLLSGFETLSLKELEGMQFMDRTETKYLLPVDKLESVLMQAQACYKILTIDHRSVAGYETLYYDTENFDLYNHHHKGKLNRYKVRRRTYVDTQTNMLEVKFKSNKGRTIKTRFPVNDKPEKENEKPLECLRQHLPFCPDTLVPKINVSYRRITFISNLSAEKLTIDLDLEFRAGSQIKTMEALAIVEIKKHRKGRSAFEAILKNHHISESSFSKYCFGVASLYTELRSNNFKPTLAQLTKLAQHP